MEPNSPPTKLFRSLNLGVAADEMKTRTLTVCKTEETNGVSSSKMTLDNSPQKKFTESGDHFPWLSDYSHLSSDGVVSFRDTCRAAAEDNKFWREFDISETAEKLRRFRAKRSHSRKKRVKSASKLKKESKNTKVKYSSRVQRERKQRSQRISEIFQLYGY